MLKIPETRHPPLNVPASPLRHWHTSLLVWWVVGKVRLPLLRRTWVCCSSCASWCQPATSSWKHVETLPWAKRLGRSTGLNFERSAPTLQLHFWWCTIQFCRLIYIYMYILCVSKFLFLAWLINRKSLRAASCLVFKTMTYLNSLKPSILYFMFQAVAKTYRNLQERTSIRSGCRC